MPRGQHELLFEFVPPRLLEIVRLIVCQRELSEADGWTHLSPSKLFLNLANLR